jgi:hypothetical protein
MLPESARTFLLENSDPSVRYRTFVDLLGKPETDAEVVAAREMIGREGWAASILADQQPNAAWERFDGHANELYRPKYIATNWRLIVLSDLGATRKDPRVERAAALLLDEWSAAQGDSFGGSDSEVCITGNSVRMLTRFGFGDDPRVRKAIDWLVSVQKADGGWHCFPSETGTIDGWEALAAFATIPRPARSEAVRRAIERGAEFYLARGILRESDGSRYAPWERVHYPNHYYYDVLVGLDTLTALGFGGDARLRPALELLDSKRRADGTWPLEGVQPDLEPDDEYHPTEPVYPFLLESVGLPSRWVTLLAQRVHERIERP